MLRVSQVGFAVLENLHKEGQSLGGPRVIEYAPENERDLLVGVVNERAVTLLVREKLVR